MVRDYLRAAPAHSADLIRARASIKAARNNLGKDTAAVLTECQRARELFRRLGNECGVEIADYWAGYACLRQPRPAEALDIFERGAESCERNRHTKMLGRIYNAMADAHFGLNNYSVGLDYSLNSLRIAEEAQDQSALVWTSAQLAIEYKAANVPVVVASLWPVDSAATSELMINFHRLRTQRRLPTIEALRQAKPDMLTGLDPLYRKPYYWAPFTVIGGHATY